MWSKAQFDYRPMAHPESAVRVTGYSHPCGLNIAKLVDRWHIVHAKSGYDLGAFTIQRTMVRAKFAVGHIAGLMNWHAPRETFGRDQGNALAASLQEIGCWNDD